MCIEEKLFFAVVTVIVIFLFLVPSLLHRSIVEETQRQDIICKQRFGPEWYYRNNYGSVSYCVNTKGEIKYI